MGNFRADNANLRESILRGKKMGSYSVLFCAPVYLTRKPDENVILKKQTK